ncbi:hypothetical protein E5F05_09640 [Deinococcus metallilatus]|uniref:Uncharacterized protein n=1 Tax=Deinococcus metallilatus TaxID=1211322 RepID=A0AAJ5F7V1_9DEIO|nr:hypothetical protein [Deinococcus metallilatus]MBB5296000.1 hypothetical protein [Deinococcus metallilatus]QBY08179.1 hypothetical protein E5F05_09640 [Deinococcus metallilatus]RXJ11911.1 hypothetical protein ERJ73_08450 [Deinococcus metallilatus]TLK25857.1 hypothetical protein FCS05_12530 [Deinococcus metallilatus]GMA14465.1 hypothetical protein GCM10025871_07960 [Deinococcus metallilatus]
MNRLPTVLTLAALLAPGLVGCGPREQSDLTARVLFTANGSYDAQADIRDRLGGGLRRDVWTSHPPLPARAVTVRYDGNNRTLAWEMLVQAPQFSARSLAGEAARTVQTPQGEAFRPAAGRLEDVLILPTADGLRLLTRGYAAQQEPALLPAFR